MTQALQLFTVVLVGFGLAWYGLVKGRKERCAEQRSRSDSRQQPLFPDRDPSSHTGELVIHVR